MEQAEETNVSWRISSLTCHGLDENHVLISDCSASTEEEDDGRWVGKDYTNRLHPQNENILKRFFVLWKFNLKCELDMNNY